MTMPHSPCLKTKWLVQQKSTYNYKHRTIHWIKFCAKQCYAHGLRTWTCQQRQPRNHRLRRKPRIQDNKEPHTSSSPTTHNHSLVGQHASRFWEKTMPSHMCRNSYPGLKSCKTWECSATLLMSICRILSHMGEGVMDLFACKSQTIKSIMLKREQTHSACACWPPRPTGDCSSENYSFCESELSSTNDFHCSSASRSQK